MNAVATMVRSEPPPARAVELVLAHAHLRLGALALARVELETMATLGMLDGSGLVDLAEVRWRTGDLIGAGDAAGAAMQAGVDDPIALTIAAEVASSLGRPSEARRLAQRAMATAGGSIDAIFAGMPRAGVWPPDADEPPPTAPTLFDRGPEIAAPPEGAASAEAFPASSAAPAPSVPTGPVTLGFWDDDELVEPAPIGLPEPGAALELGRAALVAGSLDEAALHLGLALRLAPALAPAVLEATAGARGPAVAMVRGDAYRLAGHEAEAQNAYADAARGGPPERRKKARIKPPKTAATGDVDGLDLDQAEALDEEAGADATAADAAIGDTGGRRTSRRRADGRAAIRSGCGSRG